MCDTFLQLASVVLVDHSSIMLPPMAVLMRPMVGAFFPADTNLSVSASAKYLAMVQDATPVSMTGWLLWFVSRHTGRVVAGEQAANRVGGAVCALGLAMEGPSGLPPALEADVLNYESQPEGCPRHLRHTPRATRHAPHAQLATRQPEGCYATRHTPRASLATRHGWPRVLQADGPARGAELEEGRPGVPEGAHTMAPSARHQHAASTASTRSRRGKRDEKGCWRACRVAEGREGLGLRGVAYEQGMVAPVVPLVHVAAALAVFHG